MTFTMPPYDGLPVPESYHPAWGDEPEPQQPPELTDEMVDAMPWLIPPVEVEWC